MKPIDVDQREVKTMRQYDASEWQFSQAAPDPFRLRRAVFTLLALTISSWLIIGAIVYAVIKLI